MDQASTSGSVSGIEEVALAWDVEAPRRSAELLRNDDPVYSALTRSLERTIHVLVAGSPSRILDSGCGLGFVSASMAKQGHSVTATDVSSVSIQIARKIHGEDEALRFQVDDPVGARRPACGGYDVVIANMVLHNTPDLAGFLASAFAALRPMGTLLATVTDPEAYLRKQGIARGFEEERRFDFPLRLCLANSESRPRDPVPYWHRPLPIYYRALREAGFARAFLTRPERLGGRRADDTLLFAAEKSPTTSSVSDPLDGWAQVFS